MKFNYLSYPQMVNDALLTAEFVQSLPVMISGSLNVSADDVIVVSITSAEGKGDSNNNKRRRDLESSESKSNSGVLVSMAIPSTHVPQLQQMVSTTDSSLYDSSNGQLASLIDSSYFVASPSNSGTGPQTSPLPIITFNTYIGFVLDPNVSHDNDGNSGSSSSSSSNGDGNSSTPSDPNDPSSKESGTTASEQDGSHTTGGSSSSGGLSTGAIIGIAVSCGVVVYAVGTVLVIRRYRQRRDQRQRQEAEQHQIFAQSISAPIMQENSLGWSSAPPPLQHAYPSHHPQW